MQAVYPVLFTKTEECILAEAPDLEVLTEGKDMKEAIYMARDAMELMCVTLEDHKKDIPKPSDTFDVSKGTFSNEGETIVSFVDIDSSAYRRKIDTRTVRRNVALPGWLDYEAERSGINVSKVLQEALINVLGLTRKM